MLAAASACMAPGWVHSTGRPADIKAVLDTSCGPLLKAHDVPGLVVGLIQASLILILARVLFHVPMSGGWAGLSLGIFLFIVASLSLGFLISTVAKTQLQAMQLSFFYMLPSILLSGFMFPFRGMPGWAQAIGEVLPLTHFLRIVRGLLLKGNGIAEMLPEAWPILAFMVIVGLVGLGAFRNTLD